MRTTEVRRFVRRDTKVFIFDHNAKSCNMSKLKQISGRPYSPARINKTLISDGCVQGTVYCYLRVKVKEMGF